MSNDGRGWDESGGQRKLSLGVALAAAGLALVVGVLVGWLLLGRAAAPSAEQTAGPSDLAPEWQLEWVQLVADDYARSRDADRAMVLLDGMSDDALTDTLTALSAEGRSAVQQQTAGLLADGLQISGDAGAAGDTGQEGSSPGETAADETSDVNASAAGDRSEDAGAADDSAEGQLAPTDSGDRSNVFRAIAAMALVLAVGALAFIGWSWLSWRRGRAGRPGGTGDSSGTDAAVLADHEQTATSVAGATNPPDDDLGAVPWRPLRLDLGDTATVTYEPGAERFYQTWLVNDERGSLVGGVGLRSQDVGRIGVLELWFFRRGESGTDEDTATVTLVAPAASDDAVIRARLGDRDVLTAQPGVQRALAVADLELEVGIATADAGVGDDRSSVGTVTLVLTPRRSARLGEQTAVDPSEPPTPPAPAS